ncbi:hypothetical protein ACWDBF_29345 [Streptomyces angustmyceticus]|uniref:hypothetical protein n=1 Tax=Streptomyces angustmyceticus TaxID=285578 RepID=UPI0021AE3A88|nr:hypothetical protein [Streptomyces angustmyceticus]
MSAHQPSPTPEGRGSAPFAADGRAEHEARETPTMNELLAACAAASAVSTPPDAAGEARQDSPGAPEAEGARDEESPAGPGTASTGGRDAA